MSFGTLDDPCSRSEDIPTCVLDAMARQCKLTKAPHFELKKLYMVNKNFKMINDEESKS